MSYLLYVLILFPFLTAVLQAFSKNYTLRRVVTYGSTAVIMAADIIFSIWWFANGSQPVEIIYEAEIINEIMLVVELGLMVLVSVLSIKYKKFYAMVLSIAGTGVMAWFDLSGKDSIPYYNEEAYAHIYVDQLTIIMMLIIGIVGTLITVYACGYMNDYHNHHTEFKDRKCFFFSMMYVFIGAMFGLVLSSSLTWIYFFWEITSVISFLLIGYTRTAEAIQNAFRALWMNLLGGCGFCAGIVILAFENRITDLQQLIENSKLLGNSIYVAPVILIAFAALVKSAQMPFSKWLLGAMVAPTPSSALLHSATMVKAGVYLLLRLAPLMENNMAGTMVAVVGGFTFFIASLLAITVTDAKKVLAYSTISNLGLITACAGVGSSTTVWAGAFLVIFHAISKSLLFQTVGSIENLTGSRDIEDMHSLIIRFPRLAYPLMIGIAGMFLAPFGMLISKWAALTAFVESNNKIVGILLVLFICFGSATTLFYWAKWLSNVLSYKPESTICTNKLSSNQFYSILMHCLMMILMCCIFPLISKYSIMPYLTTVYTSASEVITENNIIIMVIMMVAVFGIPALSGIVIKKNPPHAGHVYMNGINQGDELSFADSMGGTKRIYLTNWYMVDYFGESKIFTPSVLVSAATVVLCIIYTVGGAF